MRQELAWPERPEPARRTDARGLRGPNAPSGADGGCGAAV
jgi:hypothetical protein